MKCSVIVACYNNPDLILETLDSIQKQTYQNWELVLVEDCSTDNTLEVLRRFVAQHNLADRCKLIALPQNHGVSFAKGTGVQHSSGEIIVICDHDDALAPNALAEIVKAHQAYPKASIVYTQRYNCDYQLRPLEIAACSQVVYSDILEDQISHLLTYKRSCYNQTSGYDPFFKLADDRDIIYKLEEVGEVIFLEKPLYYFRISDRGISQGYEGFNNSRDEKLIAALNAVTRRNASRVKQITHKAFSQFLAEHYLLQAEGYILMEKPLSLSFLISLLKSFYYNPLSNLTRKLKALLLITRIKRSLVGILSRK
ncbi:glycosyltransferase family 2 protein [Pontibacter oryzae]|uniref:Glycosyltransferase n=1 Tax=Pontibacter oryzae TaxID=2304593 RepID=A0A399SF60_9BACT|nr:glycosyltransferase [Pontibacter oryzae]RIJ42756.1 glycosyltransferase [Pontibacter oryzae]